jgi:TolB-like protein
VLLAFLTISIHAEEAKITNVAIMPLNNFNITQDEAKALTIRLIDELQNLAAFEVLEREQMQEILKEQGFQHTGACDETSCLVEIGKLLAVEKIIGGFISKIGETYTVQARMIDLQTGKVEKIVSRDYKGGIDILMTLGMREVAAELCGKLARQTSVKVIITPEQRYRMERKSPVLGCLMSALCPGLGQVYCKQYILGAVFFSSFLAGFGFFNQSQYSGMVLFFSSWIGATVEAPFAIIHNNDKLKEKYGISLQLDPNPREPGISLNLTF